MEENLPPSLRTPEEYSKKHEADISAWIIRSHQDVVRFLNDGVDPNSDNYDEFKSSEDVTDFIIGQGDYSDSGLFLNESDAYRFEWQNSEKFRCPGCVDDQDETGFLELEYEEERSQSHRLDADERVEIKVEIYCPNHDGFSLEYTEVRHE